MERKLQRCFEYAECNSKFSKENLGKFGKSNVLAIEEKKVLKYETLDELIELLIEVRVDLTVLCKSVNNEYIKEELKWAIKRIDLIGCEFSQNIKKKLKEKEKEKINLKY